MAIGKFAQRLLGTNTSVSADGKQFELWTFSANHLTDIVGESFFVPNIQHVLRSLGRRSGLGEAMTTAMIHPVVDRRHGKTLQVTVSGRQVGSIAAVDVESYWPVFEVLMAHGLIATAECRVWSGQLYSGDISGSVKIALDEPGLIYPLNVVDGPSVELPSGNRFKVKIVPEFVADLHQVVSAGFDGVNAAMAGTLGRVVGGTGKPKLSLMIGGDVVGVLTPKQSENLVSTVQWIDGLNGTVSVRVFLRETSSGLGMWVSLPTAEQLDAAWKRRAMQRLGSGAPELATAAEPQAEPPPLPSFVEPAAIPLAAVEPVATQPVPPPNLPPPPPSVPAGWFADPTGRHQHRYWDGSTWTAHISDNGLQGSDPV